ncbi:MAG: ThiF family adenylyltransferase [Thermodesulfobacteriota bacterium]
MSSLQDKLKKIAKPLKLPDGSPYLSLSLEKTSALADEFGIGKSSVETTALGEEITPERYARNMKSFSFEDQMKLLNANIGVVGLGGLGGVVCEILARLGIGKLTLIDGDAFQDSNLNRQFLCTEEGMGGSKAGAAAGRIKKINSSVAVQAYDEFINEQSVLEQIRSCDAVADCLDTIHTRFILERAVKTAGIPLVSGAVSGSWGQATTIFPEDTGFQSIYGNRATIPDKGSEAVMGCLAFVVTLIASIESSEIVKVILKKGALLRNRLFVADLTDNIFEIFHI